ncbi:MAG: hypothetical protein COA78_02195 [Blastopirellula sp.]|nr:MAG: hypothetical protein COA78_02195 [Blastopirellula sp.]
MSNQNRVAPPTIPELTLLQNQTYSERRRCRRRPSEVTAAKKIEGKDIYHEGSKARRKEEYEINPFVSSSLGGIHKT